MGFKTSFLFDPPVRDTTLSKSEQRYLASIQRRIPLVVGDTSAGNLTFALPPAGLDNSFTGQSSQNAEYIIIKGTADANTITVTGGNNGSVALATQYSVARFKSDGVVWWSSCCVTNATDIVGILSLAHGGTSANLSATGGPHEVLQQTSVGGAITVGQLAFTDISGSASSGQIPNLDASKITTGQLALARGGTHADLSATGGASQVLKQVSAGADITVGQLAFTDISGTATTGQIPNLDASKITTGQLALARGGTNADLSATGGTSFVLRQSSVGANVTVSQLAFSDLSGFLGPGQTLLTRNAQTGTSYAILDGDRGKLVTFANSSPFAATIAQAGTAGSFADGWYCILRNLGSGTVSLTATTSTIEGFNVLVLPPGAAVVLYTDGSNYFILYVGGMPIESGAAFLSNGQINPDIPQTLLANNNWSVVSGANVVRVHRMQLPAAFGIKKVTFFRGTTTAAGKNTYVGIYDSAKNKIFQTTGFDAGSSGASTITLGTTYLLLPGSYWYAYAPDASTVFSDLVHSAGNNMGAFWSTNTVRWGTAANALAAATLPSTLGVITSISGQTVPAALFEPS